MLKMSSMNASHGEIDHTTLLSEQIGDLYQSNQFCDVNLIVDGTKFPAHKLILASRSDYFRALFYGGMRESQQSEVEIKSGTGPAFTSLLKYIYTGHLSLVNIKEEVLLDTLGLCHEFGFIELEAAVGDYLREILCIRNVCGIYDSSRLYQLSYLTRVCTNFMDRHACEIIKHDSFKTMSADSLKEILSRDSFCASEVDIFSAVHSWSLANPDADVQSVLSEVRLPLMSITELLEHVRPAKIISSEMILDAIQTISQTPMDHNKLRYRGALLPEENVASQTYGTHVLMGEMRGFLLDGNVDNYDMERGYTRHAINEIGDNGIVIKLGVQAIINHIRMLLWDRDLRSYSYYIEVSMNQKDWTRVIDHTRYYCRSWQFLYFPERVVKYIRIVGTNNTVNKVFHVVAFEAMFTTHIEELQDGLIVPKENVATVKKSATVLEGVSRSRNTLLNGETTKYDWDSGYTCHQLGSGCILVQLGQPYMIGSIRLLLWDCDDRTYSYYVETSVNSWEWEMVADRSRVACRSWQTLKFTPRPIVFIKLVGIYNSANEVFHCVHIECPATNLPSDESTSDAKSPSLTPISVHLELSGSAENGVNTKINGGEDVEDVP